MSLYFSFRYIDDVLSLNNLQFKDYLHQMYPSELEIKETTDTPALASYLDLYLYIDNSGRLKSKLYDKYDDFDFPIVNIPFLSSNIPTSPAYGVYISQLIATVVPVMCSDVLNRAKLPSKKLLCQCYVQPLLISSLPKFYCRHHDLTDRYDVSISQMRFNIFQ